MADYLKSAEFKAKADAMRERSAEMRAGFRERIEVMDLEQIAAGQDEPVGPMTPRDFAMQLVTGSEEVRDASTRNKN